MSVEYAAANPPRYISSGTTTTLDLTGSASLMIIMQQTARTGGDDRNIIQWGDSVGQSGCKIGVDFGNDGGVAIAKTFNSAFDPVFNLTLNRWTALCGSFADGGDQNFFAYEYIATGGVFTPATKPESVGILVPTSSEIRTHSGLSGSTKTHAMIVDRVGFAQEAVTQEQFLNWAMGKPTNIDFVLHTIFTKDDVTAFYDLCQNSFSWSISAAQATDADPAPVGTFFQGWSDIAATAAAAPVGIAPQLPLLGVG